MQDVGRDGRAAVDQYLGQKTSEQTICDAFIRLCYGSVAKIAILPIQDVLELDGSSRMNTPASAEGNWTWRVNSAQLTEKLATRLRDLTALYNR